MATDTKNKENAYAEASAPDESFIEKMAAKVREGVDAFVAHFVSTTKLAESLAGDLVEFRANARTRRVILREYRGKIVRLSDGKETNELLASGKARVEFLHDVDGRSPEYRDFYKANVTEYLAGKVADEGDRQEIVRSIQYFVGKAVAARCEKDEAFARSAMILNPNSRQTARGAESTEDEGPTLSLNVPNEDGQGSTRVSANDAPTLPLAREMLNASIILLTRAVSPDWTAEFEKMAGKDREALVQHVDRARVAMDQLWTRLNNEPLDESALADLGIDVPQVATAA
jgi:hypothetical protein